ncbi:MAG: argininosuccinate synthase [Actinobacteria bacterium]|nr:argininosuccinate synthase [Actinomycetota bacterium]
MNVGDLQGQRIGFCASGGLDSCTITHWLTTRGVEVVTFTADLGQSDEESVDDIAERMLACGAVDAEIVPLRREVAEIGLAAIQAQARYESHYWNTTPLARYVTVRGVLPLLAERGITVLSHGSTGRGNDQVRFQLITDMLAPGTEVYAAWRDQAFLDAFAGREDMLEYCARHGLPVRSPARAIYSTDANLLGLTHEAGELEDLATPASFVEPGMGVRPTDAPDRPEQVSIRFEKGRPVAIQGESLPDAVAAFLVANELAGRNGVGINQHLVENRITDIKSRGVYEAPGMALLGTAYDFLLQLLLDHRARRLFDFCSTFIAEQVYHARGEELATRLAHDVTASVAALVTGTVVVELYKGSVSFVSASEVPHSLYIEENASMSLNLEGTFDHTDSEGFLGVLGVGARAASVRGQVWNAIEQP